MTRKYVFLSKKKNINEKKNYKNELRRVLLLIIK